MKRRLYLLVLALTLAGAMYTASVYAIQALCTITGVVYNTDGSTCANCVVTFTPNGSGAQIINGTTIYPKIVYSTTDANGNLTPVTLFQCAAMIVTIADANGNISSEQPVPVPAASTVTISQLLSMTFVTNNSSVVNSLITGIGTVNANLSPYTVVGTDFVLLCDASSGNVTINLPSTQLAVGRFLSIKKVDTSGNTCTITPNGADTVDGAATYVLNVPYAGLDLHDSLGNWSAVGVMKHDYGTMWTGNSGSVAISTTDYLGNGQHWVTFDTESYAQTSAPISGVARDLQCFTTTACQAGGVVFTVRDGGVSQTLTCTCTNAAPNTSCSDTTHNFNVAAGDLLSVKIVNSNAGNATGVTGCSFVIH